MQDWTKRNWAVIVMGIGIPLLMFANNAWMDLKISNHLKSYLPMTIWTEWIEDKKTKLLDMSNGMLDLRKQQDSDRREIDTKLHNLDIKVDRALLILEQMQGKPKSLTTMP